MVKLVALMVSLFAFNAFAAEVMLEKHARSGLIIPEMSFKYDCTMYRDGVVKIFKRKGDGTTLSLARHLNWATTFQIRQLLRIASRASIHDSGVLCDAGTVTVTGYRNGKSIMLKDQRDCVANRYRNGRSARHLRSLATQICTF